jgi:ankyrin repeat protein
VHCQIETLRRCFPPSIRHILGELPKTLDETYERILLEIDEEKWPYAHRLFQCLVISIRPLRVDELAELFAVLPNVESTPGFDIRWRPEDPEAFILSTCSTLVAIINAPSEKVVQFSHFSVREYLTSKRIANSTPVSHFHILPRPAHTLLARACLSVLCHLDYSIDDTKIQNFPLASYAAEHWVDHAQFEDISSDIICGMGCLFDKNKPHLAAWIWLYDVENGRRRHHRSAYPTQPDAAPLYYAALCGIRLLVERLLCVYPQDLNTSGGYYRTPLHVAIKKGHLDIVLLLQERGVDLESRGRMHQTPLYVASSEGYTEVVQSLVNGGANVNVKCDDQGGILEKENWTPLLVASRHNWLEVARVLLTHGADVNHQDNCGRSPLHIASRHPSSLARLLLDYDADLNAVDTWDNTALHDASSEGQVSVVMLLLERSANVDARSKWGWTPLHEAADKGHPEVVRVLLDHGANANTQTGCQWTALHLATSRGGLQVVENLLKHGADLHSRNDNGDTPLKLAQNRRHAEIERLLSVHQA